ncbi:MAG TPA: RHS repeat protein, partial [Chloroflexi bacterium]|nr:RHS repeat protein [Chloroflexota bacterium]
ARETRDGAAVLGRVDHVWAVTPDYEGVEGRYAVELEKTSTCVDGACQATSYTYDRYGNVETALNHGDTETAGDERLTTRGYLYNTEAWIVDRPAWERLYEGSEATPPGTEAAMRAWGYDGHFDLQTPPTVGEMTHEVVYHTITADLLDPAHYYAARYGYDAWGNGTAVKDTLGRVATSTYDDVYHQFPVRACQAVGTEVAQCSHSRYYGVHRTMHDPGARFGAVYAEWGPNGEQTATYYRYDPFGRLKAVARPGDNLNMPTVAYDYALETERIFHTGFEDVCPQGRLTGDNGAWWTFAANIACRQGDAYAGNWAMGLYGPGWKESAGAAVLNAAIAFQPNHSYRLRMALKGKGVLNVNLNFGGQRWLGAFSASLRDRWQLFEGMFMPNHRNGQLHLWAQLPLNNVSALVDEITIDRVSGLRVTETRREESGCADCVHRTEYLYDGLGRAVQVQAETAEGWRVTERDFDGLGRVVREYLPHLAGTAGPAPYAENRYDKLGRVTQVTYPDGARMRTYYRARQTAVVDANDHARIQTQDAYGQLVAVQEFTGVYPGGPAWDAAPYATTRYAYDVLGNLTTVTDTLGHVTRMTYDTLGRKTAMDDVDMGHWTYEYDEVGRLIAQTDALARTLTFDYDELDRLVRKSAGEDVLAVYHYDDAGAIHGYGRGRRTAVDYPGGSVDYAYDERGRVTREVRAFHGLETYTTTYTYDTLDRVATMTYPDGEVVTQTYDEGGMPDGLISSAGETLVHGTIYNPAGQITELRFGNGLATTYAYDALNLRLQSLKTGDPLYPDSRESLAYTYDPVGNVTRIEDHRVIGSVAQVQTFQYDDLDRLVHAEANGFGHVAGYTHAYGYDAVGNIVHFAGASYRYEDPAHVHAVTVVERAGGVERYGYDANGNMTLRVEISGTRTITYEQAFDVENRLVAVTDTVSGAVTRFGYDGDGARVWKSDDAGTTLYVGEYYEEEILGPFTDAGGTVKPESAQRMAEKPPEGSERDRYQIRPMAGPVQVWADEFTSGISNGWDHVSDNSVDISWSYYSDYLQLSQREGMESRRYAIVGRNDAFDGIVDKSKYYVEIRFRYDNLTGYGTAIGVGSGTFSTNWWGGDAAPGASNVLGTHVNSSSDLTIKPFNDAAGEIRFEGDARTAWHTARLLVADGQYLLRIMDASGNEEARRSGLVPAGVEPNCIWLGNPTQTPHVGTWPDMYVDYVRVGIPETNPPADWRNMAPSGWSTETPADFSIEIRDTESGLNVHSAEYRLFENGVWGAWTSTGVSCTGLDGTRTYQTLTAQDVPIQDATRIQFRIRDMAGNTGESTAYAIDLDTSPPQYGSFAPTDWVRDTSPDLQIEVTEPAGTALHPSSGIDGATARYRVRPSGQSSWSGWQTDGISYSGTSDAGTIHVSGANLAEGDDNRVQFSIRDVAGWESISDEKTVKIDATPPVPGNLRINGGAAWTNEPNVLLSVAATDPAPGSGVADMRFCNENTTCFAGDDGWLPFAPTASWELDGQEEGLKRVYAQFRDGAGNVSEDPILAYIGLDTMPPTNTSVRIDEGLWVTSQRAVTLTLSGHDPAPSSGIGLRIRNQGENWQTVSYNGIETRIPWTLPDAEGECVVEAEFSDGAGNTVVESDSIVLDRTPPDLALRQPVDSAEIRAEPLTVRGASEVSATVEVGLARGTGARTINKLETEHFTFTLMHHDLALGWDTLVVTATDGALNTTVVTRAIFYDNVGPRIENLAPTGAVEAVRPTISASFVATTTVVDPATAHIYFGGTDVTTRSTVTADGFSFVPDADLQERAAPYAVAAGVCDVIGNCTDARWNFRVDRSTYVTITHPTTQFNRRQTDVLGRAEPGAGVILQVNAQVVGAVQADADGRWAFPAVTLDVGPNELQATGVDSLGHEAQDRRTVTVNLDGPWAQVEAHPPTFSPAGAIRFTTFDVTATAPLTGDLAAWRFTITGAGETISDVVGAGAPQATLVWHGRDAAGDPRPEGVYDYQIVVTATNGQAYGSPVQQVRIDNTPPAAPIITVPPTAIETGEGLVWMAGSAESDTFITLYNDGVFTTTLAHPTDETGYWGGYCPLHDRVNRIVAVANDTTGIPSPPSNEVVITHVVRPPLYEIGTEPATTAANEPVTLWALVRGEEHPDGAPTTAAWAYPPLGGAVELTRTNVIPEERLERWTGVWDVPDTDSSDEMVILFYAVDEDNQLGDGKIGIAIRNTPPAPEIVSPRQRVFTTSLLYLAGRVRSHEPLTVSVYHQGVRLGAARSVGFRGQDNWGTAVDLATEGHYRLAPIAESDFGLTSAWGEEEVYVYDRYPPTVTVAPLPGITNAETLPLAWQGDD